MCESLTTCCPLLLERALQCCSGCVYLIQDAILMETGSSWFYNHERKASRRTWVSRDGNYKIEKGPADDLGPVQLFFGGQEDTLFQQPTPRTQIPLSDGFIFTDCRHPSTISLSDGFIFTICRHPSTGFEQSQDHSWQ